MALQYFESTASAADIAAATRKDGGAIVLGLASEDTVDAVASELRGYFDTQGHKSRNNFTGHNSNRCHVVLGQSPTSIELIAHDMLMAVADEILLPHCESYQIGSVTAIEVNPGQKAQELHRDDSMYPVQIPGLETQISCMWALTDFTEENGATHVVPGSPMPAVQLPAELLNCLSAFLLKVNAENASALENTPELIVRGARVYQERGCGNCHVINGLGVKIGPPLNGVADRRSKEWVAGHFREPAKFSPETTMPPFDLSPEETEAIIAYLFELPKS